MERKDINDIGKLLLGLINHGEDYIIVSVGVHGPNPDCQEGNAVATVRMGLDEATSEALYLDDAIRLARGKILREREARKAKADKGKADA